MFLGFKIKPNLIFLFQTTLTCVVQHGELLPRPEEKDKAPRFRQCAPEGLGNSADRSYFREEGKIQGENLLMLKSKDIKVKTMKFKKPVS